nr:hypothetical protein [Stenotrophomonas geniculata]
MAVRVDHEWSKSSYLAKSDLYSEAMQANSTDWQYGLWSTFLMEMLIRASISHVSPALVADGSDWNNILYALGHAPKKAKFVPRTAPITELIGRAEELVPAFTREHVNFCLAHFSKRNSELHSGNLNFESSSSSSWRPHFFAVCDVLLSHCGSSLENLFGDAEAKEAREDISALNDGAAKSVLGAINAHKVVWDSKSDEDRKTALDQAAAASLRHYGHRVNCPSCTATALVQGRAMGVAKKSTAEDGVVERQAMRPEEFFCVACGLKISGYSKLLACGLGDSYVSTSHYDAIEYFGIDVDRLARNMWEDDNNEY